MKLPWRIRNFEVPFPLNPILLPLQLNSVKDGFLKAYNSIIHSLADNDQSHLKQCLEPRLAKHVISSLNELEANNIGYHLINDSTP